MPDNIADAVQLLLDEKGITQQDDHAADGRGLFEGESDRHGRRRGNTCGGQYRAAA